MNNSWYVEQKDNKTKISIPFEIQRGLIEGDLEPGFYGEEYKYFSNCLDDNSYEFQMFFQRAFAGACRRSQKRLLWNLLVILSELSYEKLNPWGQFIALSATRNPNRDIQELGIRCFENWEDVDALELLHSCKFEEHWLQEYANEVYEENINVLCKKNQSGEMAGRKDNKSSWTGRCGSGYVDDRSENRPQHTFSVAG